MEDKKTKIKDFVKYIEWYHIPSVRLLKALEILNDIGYIEDITRDVFLKIKNAGKKSLIEFEELRESYLEHINLLKTVETDNSPKVYEKIQREQYCCELRSEILETLKKVENETYYVEIALLEKFKRDGITIIKSS